MDGQLPEIYWYVFWAVVVLLSFGAICLAERAAHQRTLKALDILRTYAERGAEPPPAVFDQLARHVFARAAPGPARLEGRAALLRAFIGFVFMASVMGALHGWLEHRGGPSWGVFASLAGQAFFGFVAAGLLLAVLTSRDK